MEKITKTRFKHHVVGERNTSRIVRKRTKKVTTEGTKSGEYGQYARTSHPRSLIAYLIISETQGQALSY